MRPLAFHPSGKMSVCGAGPQIPDRELLALTRKGFGMPAVAGPAPPIELRISIVHMQRRRISAMTASGTAKPTKSVKTGLTGEPGSTPEIASMT